MGKAIRTYVPQTGEIAFYQDYKELLEPLENGYGWLGVLLHKHPGNGPYDRIQCAFCGKWLRAINNVHLKKHGFLTVREYKQEFGLALSTALITERIRNGQIERALERQIGKNLIVLRKENPELFNCNGRKKGSRLSPEDRNRQGNCTQQLIEAYRSKAQALGRTPSQTDLRETDSSLLENINYHLGGIGRAQELAGVLPAHCAKKNIQKEILIDDGKAFGNRWGRPPSVSDVRRGLLLLNSNSTYSWHFGSWGNFLRLCGFPVRKTQKPVRHLMPDMVRLYEAGLTTRDVAKTLGVSQNSVIRYLHEGGAQMRHRGWPRKQRSERER